MMGKTSNLWFGRWKGQTLGEEPELEYTFTKEEGSYNISVRVTDKTGNVAAALQKLQVSGKSLRYALQHFDPAKVWIMGHRGNSSNPNIPENSIAGIESCIELGSCRYCRSRSSHDKGWSNCVDA